jgi:hypothetical protein
MARTSLSLAGPALEAKLAGEKYSEILMQARREIVADGRDLPAWRRVVMSARKASRLAPEAATRAHYARLADFLDGCLRERREAAA